MLRKRGQKSLYEAISRAKQGHLPAKAPAQTTPAQSAAGGQPAQEEQERAKPKIMERPAYQTPIETEAEKAVEKFDWPKKPKSVAFIDKRIEFSLSYTVAVLIGLLLILVALLFFRLGQIYGSPDTGQNKQTVKINLPPPEGLGVQMKPTNPQSAQSTTPAGGTDAIPKGSNRIVIKIYGRQRDLQAAKEYFDNNGIETEIIQDNSGMYKLVTKDKNYNNPNTTGTDGYQARQKIIEIGRGYKAPQGYEQFKFEDPYGEKIP
jgi:hypothetical protein